MSVAERSRVFQPAFVIIDLQERFRRHMRAPELATGCELINHVAARFRAAGRPVVFVQDDERGGPGTDGFDVLHELRVEASDVRHAKTAANAFRTLELPNVNFVLLAGFKADGCVLASAKGAEDRDLRYAVLRDALFDFRAELVTAVERVLPIASHEVAAAMLGSEK